MPNGLRLEAKALKKPKEKKLGRRRLTECQLDRVHEGKEHEHPTYGKVAPGCLMFEAAHP